MVKLGFADDTLSVMNVIIGNLECSITIVIVFKLLTTLQSTP